MKASKWSHYAISIAFGFYMKYFGDAPDWAAIMICFQTFTILILADSSESK